jgi:hypothetical protein
MVGPGKLQAPGSTYLRRWYLEFTGPAKQAAPRGGDPVTLGFGLLPGSQLTLYARLCHSSWMRLPCTLGRCP